MGTNYYLLVNGNRYHLGKSSGGWKFCLNIINILNAIIENLTLDIEETKIVKEVYELLNNSYFKYENNELKLENPYGGMPDIIHDHKWLLDYTEIFTSPNKWSDQDHVYVQIQISVITKVELKSWIKKLLEILGSSIIDEYDHELNLSTFMQIMESPGMDIISYHKQAKDHGFSMNIEYKIGNLRCSPYEEFY